MFTHQLRLIKLTSFQWDRSVNSIYNALNLISFETLYDFRTVTFRVPSFFLATSKTSRFSSVEGRDELSGSIHQDGCLVKFPVFPWSVCLLLLVTLIRFERGTWEANNDPEDLKLLVFQATFRSRISLNYTETEKC